MEHLRILLMWSLLSTVYQNGDASNDCIDNCDSCSSSTTCDTCSTGYYRSSQSTCVQCPSGCSSCTSTTQCTECPTGYYKSTLVTGATYCYACSDNCVSCTIPTRCTTCEAGYYRYQDSSNNYICSKCPTHCVSCSSNTLCSECETGHYGTICNNDACQEGYYNDGNGCTKCIRDNCASCSSYANCDQCEAGYYRNQHQYCVQCPTQCSSCSSSTQCTACKSGRYGVTCSYSCQTHCVNSQCTIAGCTIGCKGRYYKHTDNSCYRCPTHCITCSNNTWCTGCDNGHTGDTCNQCIANYYKRDSTYCYACPTHCTTCSSATQCSTCYTGYTGTICDQCIAGYYRHQNKYCWGCPTHCITCSSKTECTECTAGRYGATCEHSCQDHCINGECAQSGCTKGCRNGYYKDNDNVCKTMPCSLNCISCSSGTYCNQCNTGYYAQFKSAQHQDCLPCPSYCSSCASSTHCTVCKTGHYGTTCNQSCQNHCVDGACAIDGCTRGCRNGYYKDSGNVCKTCSPNCNDIAKCNSDNGACANGCKPGWTGIKCLENCPVNCEACSQVESNQCITCERGYYGASCENKCSGHCINKNNTQICIKDNGTCSLGCVQGHWGNTCDNVCSQYCIDNLLCSSKDGGCDRCTPERYGHQCDLECSNNCDNPNNGSNICDRGTGACMYGCTSGKSGATCGEDGSVSKQKDDQKDDEKDNTIVIAGGGAAGVVVLAVVVVVVLCVVLKKRRHRGSSNTKEETSVTLAENEYPNCHVNSNPVNVQREESAFMEAKRPISNGDSKKVSLSKVLNQRSTTDADEVEIEIDEEDDNELVTAPVPEQSPDTYYNMAGLVRGQIAVDKLHEYVNKRTKDDFGKEFEKLPIGLIRPCNAAMQNKANNRYAKIYPYDASRVVLISGPSDYINASYIDCYSQYNTYIGNLGPTNKIMPGYESFWTMVWQEKVEVIVMLTNLMEDGTMKCEEYWPEAGTSMTYGDVTVTCHSEDVYAEYTVRSFTAKSKTAETRTLHHIHYTAWPDKGVPDDVTGLIEFRQRVISCPMKLGGPTIVHCSAGIGRTGTYIALDILTREGRAEKTVDVFGCVMAMRGQRVNMVQTAEQYGYLHNALVHALTFDCDPIQSNKVQETLKSGNTSSMQAQFEHLKHTTDVISDDEKKAVTENKALTEKNRQGADIPGRRHRPWLHLHRKPGSSNYINAVFVNSFKQKDRYVVAQTPLPTTVVDFLTLVMQTDCPCIVSLDDITQRDKSVGMYLPAPNAVTKHGVFQVKCNSCDTKPQYTLRQLQISTHGPNSQGSRSVYHIQFTTWGKGDKVPKDSAAFLQLTRDVERMSQESEDTGPIVVHCLTGAERSGLFCVVSNLIQKMEIEHQVSVVNTVRQVKARRRRAIPDKDQYLFCHQCLAAYIQSFETYSNFAV